LAWLEQHREQILWTTGLSVVFLVASLVVAGVVLIRLPQDYFTDEGRKRRESASTAWRIGRNVVGWVLIAAGAAMLVLPGQGVLVLLIGVMLADFPGKRRLERWIISRERVFKTINSLRRRFARPALQAPAGVSPAAASSAA
jgi:hypothetical protein